jgi:hypothetical protein
MNRIRTFESVYGTDRDVESPIVLEFISKYKPESVLDVGCHWSGHTYAPEIRGMIKRYDGVDIIPDPTLTILDNYHVGNVLDISAQYDCVMCISTLEHVGISTYKADHEAEMFRVIDKCKQLGKRVLFTFPVGGDLIPDQMQTLTKAQFDYIGGEARYFYTQGAQSMHPWYEHDDQELAFRVPYVDYIGTQSIVACYNTI